MLALGLAGLGAACAPQAGEQAASTEQEAAASDAPSTEGEQGEEFSAVAMPAMAQTGWRVLGEDGAVYTTMFDADGTYRDFKNGEALQSGSWEERKDGQLCFTPEAEDRIGECWEIGMVGGDAMMQVTSDAGKTIELRQVTYIAPAEEG